MQTVRILACLALVCTWAPAGFAQQTVDSASISGRVTDASGGLVAGASVVARQLETNVATTGTTDQAGRFRFPYLRVGTYSISVELTGFRTATHRLTLAVGAAYELPIVLEIGTFDAAIAVAASASPLEAARSQIASTIPSSEVAALPLNGRNFLEVALLAPGVAPTNIASTQLFPETSAVPGISLSVNSQRNLSNNFIVDGLSANDDAAGLSGITYSLEAIEQFQVVTSGGHAELGRALGGYISIVTKSGTNTVRGSAYQFYRDDAFNARNALSGTRLPMRQSQFGGSLGGPLVKDRSFYFAAAEQRTLDQTALATIAAPDVEAVNARLEAVGYGGGRVSTGEYGNPVDTTNAFAKIEHQANPRSQLSLRYSAYLASATNSRGAGGLSAPTASSHLDNGDHTIAMSHLYFLSSRTVLETRAQYAYSRLEAPPSDAVGPAVSIAGVASFGTSSTSPTARRNTMVQAVQNLSHQRGAHALRLGADVLVNADRITFPRSLRGSYTFSSLSNFLAGSYNNAGFTQTFGATDVSQRNPNLGVFVQDEWKANTRLTLNLGLRYDLQMLETIETDTNNVSPRVGLVFAPFGSRRTLVRASAGLYFDRVPLRALANALLSAGNTTDPANLRQTSVSLSPAQAGAPLFPAILAAPVPAVTLPNLTTMDKSLDNAYSRQASVEVEQQVGAHGTVSVGYEGLRSDALLMAVNQNVPTCVAAGTNNGCRPNPTYANNSQYSSVGESNYHGLHLSWIQRASRWGQYRVSYTLSRSMNNVGEFFFSGPIDPSDLSKDWGRSDNDRRHRLVVNGSAQLRGFALGALVQAYSAPPLNITSGVTTVQGTAGRPIVDGSLIARNAGDGSAFFALSVRASRVFHISGRFGLEGMLEAFNVTNRTNVQTRNTNFGSGAYPAQASATFRQITSVADPRTLQIALRARF